MNKGELISAIAEKTGLSKADSASTLDAILEIIKNEIKSGQGVRITGFGSFSLSNRSATKGRNPLTGQEVHINARKVPKFTAGKTLKDACNT
ncbi:DNA-binding protein HU-beta [Liberibacter crescens BT-1]|uniref:DNA-binding protein HU-beta n=1 Tax=Liberibacter crescens (strain BT-1) TaxID=1215343 RepID=L0EVL9_LIBCB|nr:HU family DNA-binding protein [Liberibacter crescens]AGA64905.1 DNA-binding protein HU-beta [Liberibacter crescens BT-1]AMC12934.1 transcriptional regulator HU subunit alpha [Liberibacter crescens]